LCTRARVLLGFVVLIGLLGRKLALPDVIQNGFNIARFVGCLIFFFFFQG
jgi:ABC-type uncharacterized transport system permease subunit